LEFRPLSKREQEARRRAERIYEGDRLSLNFQDIEVRAVLALLGEFTGLNMVVSDTVGGNITLRLRNVPWDQAMDIILKSKGLSMRRTDNVILVAPTEEIAAREKLELESQQQIEELAPLRSELVQVNYAKASDLAVLLKSKENKLLSERGSVTIDERTNTLLVQDTAQKLTEIRDLVNKLDIPVRQVLIESRIVLANDDFAKDLGVKLGASKVGTSGNHQYIIGGGQPGDLTYPDAAPIGIENPGGSGNQGLLVNLPQTLSGSRGGSINFVLGKLGSHLLRLELSAMQQEGRGEIISSPRVITSDQNRATIKTGREIPYQEASSSGATSVSFKEAVLQLDVTPHITPDDRVMMDLKVNKDSPDFSNLVLGVPPVNTNEVQTSVLVDNGETVVLGGVFERDRSTTRESIPFFGDLPAVGVLFRQTQEQDNNSELLIFITPKILKDTLTLRR
jgi:type IV pilus assembly protein PilQ